jgi:serine/threonine-protein kinase
MADTERDKSNETTPEPMDSELARLLTEQNFATQQEIEDCMAIRAGLGYDNSQRSLSEVLIEHGICTDRQIFRAKQKIEESRRGQQIPGYQIKSKLGSGAMATVFKARQMSLDRIVAIKVLPRKLSENPEYVERFYKEGKAAAKLNHTNIVQAYDVGEAGGWHYFVMEYVEGHSLYDELARGKIFSESEALDLIIQTARALEHAHKHGLVHRDVKPKNIMITKDGIAKLADMGLARATEDVEAAQAEAGKAYGTPYYISPEQIRGEVDIDFRADIYSLGATLYHLVTGRVPFEAPKPAAVMHKHLKEPLVPPDHINSQLSAGLGEIVETMMAKNRDNRYSSTSDLLADLESVRKGQPPMYCRQSMDASLLAGLERESDSKDQKAEIHAVPVEVERNFKTVLIILGGALAISLILNILLLFSSGS